MNKYDFDFRRIEDVLYDVLGIVKPTDIMSLKMQIRESLKALSDAIDKKKFPEQEDKVELQKQALYRELDSIATETDLDKVLRKCVIVRSLTLLGLEVKIRPNKDSFEETARKKEERSAIFAVSDLVKNSPSIVELMEHRNLLLNYIDSENRIIPVDTELPKFSDSATSATSYPNSRLDIIFHDSPKSFVPSIDKCLQEAGIYAYDYGEVKYSEFPDESGTYTQEKQTKKLVGLVKKDEFGEVRKYAFLMDERVNGVPPEFFRDVLFSDMLLRNAKNNMGFLGAIQEYPEDVWYKFKVVFDQLNLQDMLRAIYFENNPEMVSVHTNFEKQINLEEAYEYIQKKLEKAVQELLADSNSEKNTYTFLGDDREDV